MWPAYALSNHGEIDGWRYDRLTVSVGYLIVYERAQTRRGKIEDNAEDVQ